MIPCCTLFLSPIYGFLLIKFTDSYFLLEIANKNIKQNILVLFPKNGTIKLGSGELNLRCTWIETKSSLHVFMPHCMPTRAWWLWRLLSNCRLPSWPHTSPCGEDRVCACMPRWLLGFPLHTPLGRHCNFCWHFCKVKVSNCILNLKHELLSNRSFAALCVSCYCY